MPNTAQGTTHTSTYSYDANGHLSSVSIADGRPRTVSYVNDAAGQILERREIDGLSGGDPRQVWWFFDGKQVGATGNDGNDDPDYTTAIDERMQVSGTGAFRLGSSQGTRHSDFDQAYDSLSPGEGGGGGGAYTVRAGDTLASVAQASWGDASLWYLIADANGLTGAAALVPGQLLRVPAGLANLHNTADTFRPYDAARAIGDTAPTTPQPAKAKKKCGGLGAILLAVVAVAVTVVVTAGAAAALTGQTFGAAFGAMTGGAALGGATAGTWIAAGVAGGAMGSLTSQGVGLATGLQDKFSWKAVGLSALAGGVGGGLGASGLFGSGALAAAARGVLGSVITQGIGVATGLQSKFGWAGIAAAGVGAGIGKWVGGGPVLSNAAAGIAASAAESLIGGKSFGDTLMGNLPGIIANTVGSLIERGLAGTTPEEDQIAVNQDAIDRALAGLPRSTPSIDLLAGFSLDQQLALGEISGRITADRAQAIRAMRNDIAAGIVMAQNAAGSSQNPDGRFLSADFAGRYGMASSYSVSGFELGRRKADFEAFVATFGGHPSGKQRTDIANYRASLQGDEANLNTALAIADRSVVDVLNAGVSPLGTPVAGWRMFVNGEYTTENKLTLGLSALGAMGGTIKIAKPLLGASENITFTSFSALKRHLGSPGIGNHWHHIVEKTPGNLKAFGAEVIHSADNVVAVPADAHIGKNTISAYYSSKDFFTNGQTVRQWLSTQSFQAQRQFGLETLKRFGQ